MTVSLYYLIASVPRGYMVATQQTTECTPANFPSQNHSSVLYYKNPSGYRINGKTYTFHSGEEDELTIYPTFETFPLSHHPIKIKQACFHHLIKHFVLAPMESSGSLENIALWDKRRNSWHMLPCHIKADKSYSIEMPRFFWEEQ